MEKYVRAKRWGKAWRVFISPRVWLRTPPTTARGVFFSHFSFDNWRGRNPLTFFTEKVCEWSKKQTVEPTQKAEACSDAVKNLWIQIVGQGWWEQENRVKKIPLKPQELVGSLEQHLPRKPPDRSRGCLQKLTVQTVRSCTYYSHRPRRSGCVICNERMHKCPDYRDIRRFYYWKMKDKMSSRDTASSHRSARVTWCFYLPAVVAGRGFTLLGSDYGTTHFQ